MTSTHEFLHAEKSGIPGAVKILFHLSSLADFANFRVFRVHAHSSSCDCFSARLSVRQVAINAISYSSLVNHCFTKIFRVFVI